MIYYIEFDIAAIVLCSILVLYYFATKHVKNRVNLIYISLMLTTLATGFFDILSANSINKHMSTFWVTLYTSLYYMFLMCTTFLFLSFILYQLEMDEHMSGIGKHLLRLPVIYYSLIILSNDATGWVFTYTYEKGYQPGPLHFTSYLVGLFYFGWAVIYVTLRRNFLNRSLRLNVYNISILNLVFLIIQYFTPHHMIVGYGFSVGMVMLALSTGKRESAINQKTGMLNRETLSDTLNKNFYNEKTFTTVLVRVADYDQLTNVYGIQVTETLVIEIAKYLVEQVGVGKAFQTNNSTFVLICDNDSNINGFVRAIHTKLSSAWDLEGQMISFSHLITTVACPQRAKNVDAFLACLTYFEKMKRMRFGIVPTEELAVRDLVRETLVERAIKDGLKDGNLRIFYQPICTADTQKYITAEALVRLIDPQLGFVSPAEFIPVAEKTGLMIDVGNHILKAVCHFINTHDLDALGIEYIEINLSVVQCLQRDFVEYVDDVTKYYNIDPKYICFEITETASNCSPDIFTHNLETLVERGYKLALDDYGSGYGNLERMITSSFSILKLDKEMTERICATEKMRNAFVKMVALFKSIDLKIVSEGVETETQYEFLRGVGVDYIQGFYFSKPLPEDEFLSFIQNH